MEWTTLIWIALGVFMLINMVRGGGCCGGHGSAPPSNNGPKPTNQDAK
jgi:hypothetical protein